MFCKSIFLTLLFLRPAVAVADGPGTSYFIAVLNGGDGVKGGEGGLEESYKALRGMVKLADEQGARLTLLFSAQYAVYIATDPARLAELEGWKKTGHEVGAYHQGPDTKNWDGYSDLKGEELARLGKKDGKGSAGGHGEFFEALARLEPGIRAGCMTGWADKKFRAAAPAHEVCGRAGEKGINNFVSVSGEGEKRKKSLSEFHPADKAGIEAAKAGFSSLSAGVYGATFKSSPSEFGAFYSWLAFLRTKDPQGLRSRTVSSIVDLKLLDEKEAVPVPAVKKKEKPAVRQVKQAPPEPQRELPRLRPLPSNYGKVGTLVPERYLRKKYVEPRGRCGDNLCDAYERALPGSCPHDCGQ